MPSGWLHGLYDREPYIVQSSGKEKREGDIRLWRLLSPLAQNAKAKHRFPDTRFIIFHFA